MRRLSYCTWLKTFAHSSPTQLDNVYLSNEAWVHLNGYVNSQNYRISSQENLTSLLNSLHPRKVGIWCGTSWKRIISPIFFDTSVNAVRYRQKIKDFLDELLADCLYGWEDGATIHTTNSTVTIIFWFFENCLISTGCWPMCNPDLSPCDHFLWG